MATQKPISTISYNTPAFLREKLSELYDAHIIQAYMFIEHKGEDGDKDHIHLRVEPNKKVDPMDLTDLFKEFVCDNDKPLGVRPWRPSKEEDWFLYAVHDKAYLNVKYGGGERGEKLPYEWSDIQASPAYDVETAYIRALSSLRHSSASLVSRIQGGENALNLVLEGENVYTINALLHALNSNDYSRLARRCEILEKENYELSSRVENLTSAIDDYGLIITTDDDGRLHLESNPFGDT